MAPQKHASFEGSKLLIVHPIDVDGSLSGEAELLALEPGFGAGVGDVVLVAKEGAAVAQVMASDDVPANVIILGVVDDWSAERQAHS